MNKLYDLLIHSSFYMGIVAVSITFTSSFLLDITPNLSIMVAFLVAFSVYSFNKVTDISEDSISYPSRVDFIKSKKGILTFLTAFSYVIALVLSTLGGLEALLVTVIPGISVFIYSKKWVPFNVVKRLKEVLILNTVLVSFAWAVAVTYLPLIFHGEFPVFSSLTVFSFFFLRVFITTEAFNIRDIKGDRATDVPTFPIRFGIENTRYLLYLINLLSFLMLGIAGVVGVIKPFRVAIIGPVFLYSLIYTYLLGKDRDMKTLCIFVDGEYIAMALLVLLSFFVL